MGKSRFCRYPEALAEESELFSARASGCIGAGHPLQLKHPRPLFFWVPHGVGVSSRAAALSPNQSFKADAVHFGYYTQGQLRAALTPTLAAYMPSRADVQNAHELAVLNAALAEHNRIHGLSLTVVSRPDPPDAILSDGNLTTWMELTDAFFSPAWARDLVSNATDEEHKPMEKGPYMNMDSRLAGEFCDLVCKKAGKDSYKPFISQYGPGILVVGLESPWLSDETIDEIDAEWSNRGSPDISKAFAHVYLGYRNGTGNHALKWPRS